MELYNKHRPKKFKYVLGQERVIEMITNHLKENTFPRAVTFTGPSGVGKTTVARIIRDKIGCFETEYEEVNAASETGIELARRLDFDCRNKPWTGDWRLYVIDEAHQLTKPAQNCLLKVLEEPPKHARFILCTTEPEKLLSTIRTRCHEFCFDLVPDEAIEKRIWQIIKKEAFEINKKVVQRIVLAAEGSMRRGLNFLQGAMTIKDEKKRLDSIFKQSTRLQVIDLVRLVINNPRASWKEVAGKLRSIQDEPENIRRAILGYASSILLNGQDNARAHMFLVEFRDDTFSSGRAGLIESLYSVCHAR